ncbi:MAG: methyltransferase domain-containing protein [Pseudomonadota bacterium]
MIPPDIFSRQARRRFRDRAVASDYDSRWLSRLMATELADRVDMVKRHFDRVLIIGNSDEDLRQRVASNRLFTIVADAGFRGAARADGVQCDEDRLPFADASFDLVLAPGGLDIVNDLPGALALIRRILMPDGLFLGAMAGAGGLETLRNIIVTTTDPERIVARHHPQIDVRAAGDLLTRAGFLMPVVESQNVTARYPDLFKLISDLRANAMTNTLSERQPLRRDQVAKMATQFSLVGDPKTAETFSLIFMTGWAPPHPVPIRL